MNNGSYFVAAKQKPDAQVRLICFPHAGGGPAAFFAWNAFLGPEIESVCVQYPGHALRWREPACSSLMDLADEIVSHWEEMPYKPCAFYGHSFGGLVAFEVARRLSGLAWQRLERLFVGSSRAPQLDLLLPPVHELPDEEFVEAVQARYGGIPAEILADRESLKLFVRPLRRDLQAYEGYHMADGALLAVPITAFAGAEDRAVPPARMQGWQMQTKAEFELRVLPGGHFLTPDNRTAVTSCIQDRLLGRRAGAIAAAMTEVSGRAEAR